MDFEREGTHMNPNAAPNNNAPYVLSRAGTPPLAETMLERTGRVRSVTSEGAVAVEECRDSGPFDGVSGCIRWDTIGLCTVG